ncbi:acyltransferase [Methanobrevibacter sp.]|uniref:acyltransferase n=1 Tax=Methanobrevibacter sp. TaxID=66852 RepID=UPI0026DF347C|nr:acyltransferase family protein [Methanobrevibacter sp.]
MDWIKALAVFAVAIIHVSGRYLEENLLFTSNWFIAVGFESLTRYAVVFFILASGFLILRKPEPITNIPRRFKRIFVPFVFWMFIYAICYYFLIDGYSDVFGFVKYFFYGFIDPTSVCLLFWFVYMIIGLYVFAPILSKWIENSSFKEIEYFLAVWIVVMILYLAMTLTGYDTIIYDYLRYFGGAIGYFILGYYLAFKDSRYLQSRKFGLLLFIIGTFMCFVGTVGVAYITGVQTFAFMSVGDITPNACLQAVGLFIIVKNTSFNKLSDRINSIIVLISLESYGFYLAHLLVIGALKKLSIFSLENNALVTIPLFSICVLVSVNVLIYIMSKIPFLNKFTGFKSIL